MQAAVAEIQRERKYVGVTHDALWERINSDILPYAAGDAHDATQQPSPQDDFLREHLVVATITGPAGSPTPPQSEGTPEKRQKSGTSSVAEQRKAILQSLPEDLRKAHKGAPLSKLKELAAQHGRNEESSPEDQLAANGTSYGTVDKPDTIALAHHFSAAFLTGRKFGTIVEARREAASLLGGAVRPATETAKAVDEAIELGVTLAAQDCGGNAGTAGERYGHLSGTGGPVPASASIERAHQHQHGPAGLQHTGPHCLPGFTSGGYRHGHQGIRAHSR